MGMGSCCYYLFSSNYKYIGLIGFELLIVAAVKSGYPDLRFKEGKSHWLTKLIDFMNKEF